MFLKIDLIIVKYKNFVLEKLKLNKIEYTAQYMDKLYSKCENK
ncbi:hypothetical protein EDD79_104024 [Serpentinicella alkaliphila]|uniref:Uncharacterized protein n=1 Tax=Serpentinicella alkaliphila TaxID=1734049 RepID=A0A4R2TTL0_9FIRM|nr:hypothetical protein [Serpentinicella alkaliphila]TCP98442.1 hypothetical protein EDD79_104024 [Serpentinicella alkaliphila]